MNNPLELIVTVVGWVGALELLAAYFLVSRKQLVGDSLRYQGLNVTGSLFLLVSCLYTGAWPSALLNVFYLLVGISILLTVKRERVGALLSRLYGRVTGRRSVPATTPLADGADGPETTGPDTRS